MRVIGILRACDWVEWTPPLPADRFCVAVILFSQLFSHFTPLSASVLLRNDSKWLPIGDIEPKLLAIVKERRIKVKR